MQVSTCEPSIVVFRTIDLEETLISLQNHQLKTHQPNLSGNVQTSTDVNGIHIYLDKSV